MGYILLFVIAFAFISNWLVQNKDYRGLDPKNHSLLSGRRSFAFQKLNDVVFFKEIKNLYRIEDSIKRSNLEEQLDSVALGKQNTTSDSLQLVNPSLSIYKNRLRILDKAVDSLLDTTQIKRKLITSDSIYKLADSGIIPLPHISFGGKIATKGDLGFIELLKKYLISTSTKITDVSKLELGIQIRSVQAKGMLLLISLFFSLMALFIFFKIINRVHLLELGLSPTDKMLQDDYSESGKALSSVWLIITVTAWLLLPIFKLVEDADINLDEPYKSPTFLGDNDARNALKSGRESKVYSLDTLHIFNKYDTLQVKLLSSKQGLDTPSVMDLLKEIIKKADNIGEKADKIDNQLKN